MEKEKSRRQRFTYEDDIIFLRKVVGKNPIKDPGKWENVQINVERTIGKLFQIKTLKQHLQLILELWLKKDSISQIRSGTEEPYSEKDVLLQEVSLLTNEASSLIKKKKKVVCKEKQISDLGKEAREKIALEFEEGNNGIYFEDDSAGNEIEIVDLPAEDHNYFKSNEEKNNAVGLEPPTNEVITRKNLAEVTPNKIPNKIDESVRGTPSSSNHVTGPIRKRNNRGRVMKKDALTYLQDKNDKENRLRLKELELEEKKMLLEERKLALEERKIRLQEKTFEEKNSLEKEKMELEISEKKMTTKLLESQQKIIESLVLKLNN